ncbi:MAG: hypothetical protein OSA81_08235 [Longimicrobiales bacterium]|nr:hypothetical protein [Longimicrobiales bacterium]
MRHFVHTSRGLSNTEHIEAFVKHMLGIQAGEGAGSRKSGPMMTAYLLRGRT